MKEFWIGVNYWASHAGTDMWKNWSEETVRRDFAALKQSGVEVLRVFPNWRDFQPVAETFGACHNFREYRMADDSWPENPNFLDETMLQRFNTLCVLAQENGLRLIVGLITGWMSGRLFLPPALQNRNLFADPSALWLQQLFVRGFVNAVKHQPAVIAWDLGNECNCMEQASSREQACHWTATVVDAIKASDPGRPVISGMHSLEPEGAWTPADQGYLTDLLTTHPYPYWVEHCSLAPLDHFRTLLHATAQNEYYAGLGGKNSLVEEIGTMGPMICKDEIAAQFMRVNLWSSWVHGAAGLLWWCAFDQNNLTAAPYDWNMCERELGLLKADRTAKPVADELRRFAQQQKELALDLPPKTVDAVCVLTKGQDQWGVAYMSYLLGKQAGLTLRFAWQEQPLPESSLYLLPSIRGDVMSKRRYDALKEKIRAGASLYISMDGGILTEFEELTGFRVERWSKQPVHGLIDMDKSTLAYDSESNLELVPVTADVLVKDKNGAPVLGRHAYGKGTVYLCSLPLERMLLDRPDALDQTWYAFYQRISQAVYRPITKGNPFVGLTLHRRGQELYAVLINYSSRQRNADVQFDETIAQWTPILGKPDQIEPFGVVVLHTRLAQSDFLTL